MEISIQPEEQPKTKSNRFVDAIKKIWHYLNYGKWRFAIIFPLMLLGLYVLYFSFSFKSAPTTTGAEETYWLDGRLIALRVLLGVIDASLLALGIVLFCKRKLTFRGAVLIMAGIAMSVIITYSFTTPIFDYNMVWNQHDISYGNMTGDRYGGGHFGIIMNFFKTWGISGMVPDGKGGYNLTDFGVVLERYQPKFFYIVSGLFMKFNSLFIHVGDGLVTIGSYGTKYGLTNTDWATFESLRILYCYMELVQLYFIYKIFVLLRFKGFPLLVSFGVAAFTPVWCYFGNWANNDGMCCFFSVLALYYTLRFLKSYSWNDVILIAVSIGLSMSCKLGGALVALVIAPFLIYAFVVSVKNHTWKRVLIQAAVFVLIVFPIGLFWPVYNKIAYGQPILFFMPTGNSALHISNNSFLDRFIFYPTSDTFRMIWVYHSNTDGPRYLQDTSLIVALLKTSLYGEYGFGHNEAELTFLYIMANFVFVMFLLGQVYLLIKVIENGKFMDLKRTLFLLALFIVMYGWAVWFVNTNPDTCNEDIRYVPLLVLVVSGGLGSLIQSLMEDQGKHAPVTRAVGYVSMGLIAMYALGTIIGYFSLSAWYFR
jgi:hypothetical protein